MPPWPIYLAGVSLQRLQGRALHIPEELPGLALDLGFEGLSLSDRELAGFSPGAVSRLARKIRQQGGGLIFDLNADLTRSHPESLAKELRHLRRWLDLAGDNGLTRVRLALGGQPISYQRLFHSPESAALTRRPGNHSSGGFLAAIRHMIGKELLLPASRALRHLWPAPRPRPSRAVAKTRVALTLVLQWASRHNIQIGIENHWGVTTHPEELSAILDHFDSPVLGSCPDFGNFPPRRDPYQGLCLLAPRAVMAHAKSRAFDPAGEETTLDYRRCLAILRAAQFKGPICVEYEGRRDPIQGVCKTRDLIRRHQIRL